MGLSLPDIKQIVLAGFKSAFLPFHVKQAHLRKVSQELAMFTEDGPSVLPPPMPTKEKTAQA
jgi:adenosine deaminase